MHDKTLSERLASLPWPTVEDHGTAEPGPGQLWQLSWAHTRLLGFLLDVSEDRMTVAPVTCDDAGDDRTLVLERAESPLAGVPFHIWAGLVAEVPKRTLAQLIGATSPGVAARVRSAQHQPPGTFPPITSPLDNRAELRATIEDDLAELAEASWRPAADASPLRELVPHLRPGALAQVAGIEPGDADQVLNQRWQLDGAQAERVAAAFGLTPDQVREATKVTVDEAIAVRFDRPGRLRVLRARARSRGTTEVEEMTTTVLPLLQAAARTTGHTGPDWDVLIDDALAD